MRIFKLSHSSDPFSSLQIAVPPRTGVSVQTRTLVENRSNRKPNLRKPKEPDFRKKLLLSLIEPYYEKDKRPDAERCAEWSESRAYVPHPYVVMLKDDCVRELNSPFIYLFHLNSISENDFNELRKEFLRKNLYLRNYSNEVKELAMRGTRFTNLIDFFKHQSCFACSEHEKLDAVIKLCKQSDRIILLGGIFENRILNLKDLEEYKRLGGLDGVRAQLCHTLSGQSASLSGLLNHHTRELSFNLTNYAAGEKSEQSDKKNDEKQT